MSAATTPGGSLRGLPPISARRRNTDKIARFMVGLLTAIALVPLGLVLFYLLKQGLGAWSMEFFTTDPTGRTCFPGQTTCQIGGIPQRDLGHHRDRLPSRRRSPFRLASRLRSTSSNSARRASSPI